MKLLITGASGFIGKMVLRQAVERGHTVSAIYSPRSMRKRSTFHDEYEQIICDLENDSDTLKLKTEQFDTVIHLAGATQGAGLKEQEFMSKNEKITCNLLSSVGNRVKHIIYSSSQVVYGNPCSKAVGEDSILNPTTTAYGCSKINGENWIRYYSSKNNYNATILRLSGFIEGGGIYSYIKKQAIANRKIELYNKGEVTRDYLPVNDGVEAILSAVEMGCTHEKHNIMNIGSGVSMSSKEIAEKVCKIMNSKSEIALTEKKADIGDLLLDISRAKNRLNFKPSDITAAIVKYALEPI